MIKNFFKRNYLVYFITYFIVPLSIVEIFSQFRFSTGYVYEIATLRKDSEKIGLRPANSNYKRAYKIIYGDPSKLKIVKYKTDKYGTIYPSTISNAKNKIDQSTLFCGGSTTESSVVQEGFRVPDIYSKISGKISINAATSGKSLEGCIKTVDYFLKYHGEPETIVIATNINTFGQFGRQLRGEENQAFVSFFEFKSPQSGIRKIARKSFKFITPGLAKSRFHLKKQKAGEVSSSGVIDYEKRLMEGCCFYANKFNKKGSGLKFEWESKLNEEKYRIYLNELVDEFDHVIKKQGINKNKIFFFIEPNSYLNKTTSASIDLRQYLHNEEGIKVDGKTSSKWIKIYDDIYMETLTKKGFKVLKTKNSDLKSEYFYDVGHLSPSGSYFIGKFYAENL